jgi:signal transduction histidine kinase
LVELFKGKMEVTSEVGSGTTVSFHLQLQTNFN